MDKFAFSYLDRMVIRNAVQEDAGDILPLIHQLGYTSTSIQTVQEKIRYYNKEGYRLMVAEKAGRVVGFISLHVFEIFHSPGRMGRITAFCISAGERNKGIGSALLSAAELFFLESGCAKLEVTSNERRAEAHQFYLHQNYTEDSRRFVKYTKP